MIWPYTYAFQVTLLGNGGWWFTSTENPTFAEETRIDNPRNNKKNLSSWAQAWGSGLDQTVDPILNGCFLPSLPAAPLHRPVSLCHQFSIMTGSYWTAALGAPLKFPGGDMGRSVWNAGQSLDLLWLSQRERAQIYGSLVPWSLLCLHNAEIMMRWKC